MQHQSRIETVKGTKISMSHCSLAVTVISIIMSFPSTIFGTEFFKTHVADFSLVFRVVLLVFIEVLIGHGFAELIGQSERVRATSRSSAAALLVLLVFTNAWVTFFNIEFFIVAHVDPGSILLGMTRSFAVRLASGVLCIGYGLFILDKTTQHFQDNSKVLWVQLWFYVGIFILYCLS